MQVISVAVQKGGTGKTTTALTLAQAAAFKHKKALLIDLDPQGNASYSAGADMTSGNSFDLLESGGKLNTQKTMDLVQATEQGFDIIPASWNLATASTSKGSANRLKKALEPIKMRYDYIILDTPATVGELQYNALMAATRIIIPLEADAYNIQGLYQITDTALQIARTTKEQKEMGFVITKLDRRSTIAQQMQEQIIIEAGIRSIPYLGSIRIGVAIKEAAALQQNIYDYAPKSNPAKDYLRLFERIQQ